MASTRTDLQDLKSPVQLHNAPPAIHSFLTDMCSKPYWIPLSSNQNWVYIKTLTSKTTIPAGILALDADETLYDTKKCTLINEEKIKALIREAVANKYIVVIVTARHFTNESLEFPGAIRNIINRLGANYFSGVYYTGAKSKAAVLKHLHAKYYWNDPLGKEKICLVDDLDEYLRPCAIDGFQVIRASSGDRLYLDEIKFFVNKYAPSSEIIKKPDSLSVDDFAVTTTEAKEKSYERWRNSGIYISVPTETLRSALKLNLLDEKNHVYKDVANNKIINLRLSPVVNSDRWELNIDLNQLSAEEKSSKISKYKFLFSQQRLSGCSLTVDGIVKNEYDSHLNYFMNLSSNTKPQIQVDFERLLLSLINDMLYSYRSFLGSNNTEYYAIKSYRIMQNILLKIYTDHRYFSRQSFECILSFLTEKEKIRVIKEFLIAAFPMICRRNDTIIFHYLLSQMGAAKKEIINAPDPMTGNTLLHVAARYNAPKFVDILVDCGADITLQNIEKLTPIMSAVKIKAWNSAYRIAELKYDYGKAQYSDALFYSAKAGKENLSLKLLSQGATDSLSMQDTEESCSNFAIEFNQIQLVKALSGKALNKKPLIISAIESNGVISSTIEWLLEQKDVDVNCVWKKETALTLAIKKRSIRDIKILLTRKDIKIDQAENAIKAIQKFPEAKEIAELFNSPAIKIRLVQEKLKERDIKRAVSIICRLYRKSVDLYSYFKEAIAFCATEEDRLRFISGVANCAPLFEGAIRDNNIALAEIIWNKEDFYSTKMPAIITAINDEYIKPETLLWLLEKKNANKNPVWKDQSAFEFALIKGDELKAKLVYEHLKYPLTVKEKELLSKSDKPGIQRLYYRYQVAQYIAETEKKSDFFDFFRTYRQEDKLMAAKNLKKQLESGDEKLDLKSALVKYSALANDEEFLEAFKQKKLAPSK